MTSHFFHYRYTRWSSTLLCVLVFVYLCRRLRSILWFYSLVLSSTTLHVRLGPVVIRFTNEIVEIFEKNFKMSKFQNLLFLLWDVSTFQVRVRVKDGDWGVCVCGCVCVGVCVWVCVCRAQGYSGRKCILK